MIVHPKTSGALLGSTTGLLIVAILSAVHGIHMTPELTAAIPAFLSVIGSIVFKDDGTATSPNEPDPPAGGIIP